MTERTVRTAGHEPRACDAALTRAFGFLGKRWNGLLLGALVQGPAGFAELKRAVQGISDSVLSERLAELAGAGLVQRSVDEGPPVAVTYRVTEAGAALMPALEALTSWAEANLPARACDSAQHAGGSAGAHA
jgi:DNA-binding HxlR family transcriptional regulator